MVRSYNKMRPPMHLVDKIDQRLVGATTETLSRLYPRLWAQFRKTGERDTHIASVVFAAVWAVELHPAFPMKQLARLRKGE